MKIKRKKRRQKGKREDKKKKECGDIREKAWGDRQDAERVENQGGKRGVREMPG